MAGRMSRRAASHEKVFQAETISALRERLETYRGAGKIEYAIIEPFGLDAAVVLVSEAASVVRLIEFKAFAGGRAGGVGFGDQEGKGPQVDLLAQPDGILASVDPFIRWCFADLTLPASAPRYSLLTSSEARRAAMGVVRRGKQNNFRIKDVLARPLCWKDLVDELGRFVLKGLSVPGGIDG